MKNIKYQNYMHYKLPITMNPLEYGKLIKQFDNKYIIQLSTTNIVILKEMDSINLIDFFRKGDLIFQYKDTKLSEDSFSRTISDQKYTFSKSKLISTEITSVSGNITIYNDTNSILINPFYASTYLNKNVEILKTYYSIIYNYFKNNFYKSDFILYPYFAFVFITIFFTIISMVYYLLYLIIQWLEFNNLCDTFLCSYFNETVNSLAVFTSNNIIKLRKVKNVWKEFNFNNILRFLDKLILILCYLIILIFIFMLIYMLYITFRNTNILLEFAVISTHRRKLKWDEISFKIKDKVFTKYLLETIMTQFWDNVAHRFTNKNHMFILFKIKYENIGYLTIGKLQRISIDELNWYIQWILDNLDLKNESYKQNLIEEISINYGFKNGIVNNKTKDMIPQIQTHNHINIPISMDPNDYGTIIHDGNKITITQSGNLIFKIEKVGDVNFVSIIKNKKEILTFRDQYISDNKFTRILDNKKLYIANYQIIATVQDFKGKYISSLNMDPVLVNKIITLDIEIYNENGTLVPYLIIFYDGIKCHPFWIEDYKSVEEMVLACLSSIFIRKYHGYNIYMHNMAKFDIIFIMKYLVKLWDIKPIIHNGKILSITVTSGKYKFHLKDSYLILLASLDNLCKSFQIENVKSIFPHKFVSKNNLNYEGIVPNMEQFFKINNSEYNNYKDSFKDKWNLKSEAIKYCEIDCISLYQILVKFNDLIFKLFNKNIHKYPTLSSLAFAIFRTKFMKENSISQLSGTVESDIRKGYTGGAVDMYIPENPKETLVYAYDVNSLYPSQMQNQLMPCGEHKKFVGNIRDIDPNAFGFFYCKITAPDNLEIPILQKRYKMTNGFRTIAPIGTWEDMIFSPEMDNAMKFGYTFEIIWGYTFDSQVIFKNYVDNLYSLRLKYPKSDPMNFSGKILLNSLYGRFGMKDNFPNITILDKDFYPEFEYSYLDSIIDRIDLGDYWLIFYENKEEKSVHNINVAISAAITAYSRIHMSHLKMYCVENNIKLYYSDTDSIYVNKPLPEELIDSKILGKLKIEYILNKAIFLAPKVYCLETVDGKIISKVKGLKSNLVIKDFDKLLIKDSLLKRSNEKWSRNLESGKIEILDQIYTLKVTDNKRQLVYDNNSKLISTKAYRLNNDILDCN